MAANDDDDSFPFGQDLGWMPGIASSFEEVLQAQAHLFGSSSESGTSEPGTADLLTDDLAMLASSSEELAFNHHQQSSAASSSSVGTPEPGTLLHAFHSDDEDDSPEELAFQLQQDRRWFAGVASQPGTYPHDSTKPEDRPYFRISTTLVDTIFLYYSLSVFREQMIAFARRMIPEQSGILETTNILFFLLSCEICQYKFRVLTLDKTYFNEIEEHCNDHLILGHAKTKELKLHHFHVNDVFPALNRLIEAGCRDTPEGNMHMAAIRMFEAIAAPNCERTYEGVRMTPITAPDQMWSKLHSKTFGMVRNKTPNNGSIYFYLPESKTSGKEPPPTKKRQKATGRGDTTLTFERVVIDGEIGHKAECNCGANEQHRIRVTINPKRRPRSPIVVRFPEVSATSNGKCNAKIAVSGVMLGSSPPEVLWMEKLGLSPANPTTEGGTPWDESQPAPALTGCVKAIPDTWNVNLTSVGNNHDPFLVCIHVWSSSTTYTRIEEEFILGPKQCRSFFAAPSAAK